MPVAKTRRQILAPEVVKEVDRQLQTRDTQKQQHRDYLKQNARLLAPDGAADVTKAEAQAGRRMSRADIMAKLQRINPNLRYARSKRYPEQGGIYVYRAPYLLDWDRDTPGYFICGIPHHMVNEFAVRQVKQERVSEIGVPDWITVSLPDGQTPGWRAILLTLLKAGLLDPSGIDREFKITQGRSSRIWQEATQ